MIFATLYAPSPERRRNPDLIAASAMLSDPEKKTLHRWTYGHGNGFGCQRMICEERKILKYE